MINENRQILLTESETLQTTIDCLIQHIPLETQGGFSASDLYQILVRAASNCDSIENTSKMLKMLDVVEIFAIT